MILNNSISPSLSVCVLNSYIKKWYWTYFLHKKKWRRIWLIKNYINNSISCWIARIITWYKWKNNPEEWRKTGLHKNDVIPDPWTAQAQSDREICCLRVLNGLLTILNMLFFHVQNVLFESLHHNIKKHRYLQWRWR